MQSDDPLVSFGTALRKVRSRRGLSQEELAMQADLDRTYVSGVERGVRNICLRNIYKLADALGVHPVDFFKGIEDRDG